MKNIFDRREWFTLTSFAVAGSFVLGQQTFRPVSATRQPTPTETSVDPEAMKSFARLLEKAKTSYQKVTDYTCFFLRQERVRDALQAEQTAQLSVRTKPFSIAMKFIAPAGVSGQEVVYVTGRNDGKMRVKGAGLKGAVGYLSMAVDDPRAVSQSRHTILEAGIGAMIDEISKAYCACQEARCKVIVSEALVGSRKCQRVDIVVPEKVANGFHRCVIFFDSEHGLPIRFEAYEMPTKENPAGELLECYSYLNLKLNIGVPDTTFAK